MGFTQHQQRCVACISQGAEALKQPHLHQKQPGMYSTAAEQVQVSAATWQSTPAVQQSGRMTIIHRKKVGLRDFHDTP